MDNGLIPRKQITTAAPGLLAPGGAGGGLVAMGDILPPKRQAVVDRLRRRIESYRRRQNDCIPRYDQSFNGLCEQNIQDTLALKHRFLETKAKRAAKKTDKKQDNSNSLQNNLHNQQKFLKRTAEELEPPGGSADAFEPPAKIQCTGGQQQQRSTANQQPPQQQTSGEALTKFSVEIVQQYEFTASAANSQPQQISTNVTVKALTNASVKSDVASPKSGPGTPASSGPPVGRASNCVDIGNLVECKQELPDSEFVDLEQCAAALEKDVAANGTSFPGFPDLIGDDTSDEIITSDALKDLISEISDFPPEFMKDFGFEDKSVDSLTNSSAGGVTSSVVMSQQQSLKTEDDSKDILHQQQQQHQNLMDVVDKPGHNSNNNNSPSPLMAGNAQYSPQPVYDPQSLTKSRMAPYSGIDFSKAELSPAAQTLKQMAEQHQHKTQLGMNFNPAAAVRNVRSPYGEYQYSTAGNEYLGSPGSVPGSAGQVQNHNTSYLNKQPTSVSNSNANNNNFVVNSSQSELIKQEVMFSATQNAYSNSNLSELQKRQVMQQLQQQQNNQQQQGKPGTYGAAKQQQQQQQQQQYSPYGSPGSLPNHGSPQYLSRGGQAPQMLNCSTPPRPPSCPSSASLQVNQAQQIQISQPGQQIQVTAGQHMQLTGDLKPGVSVAAQQGMYFTQQPAPNQQTDNSYSISQSQTINFTQQSLRQRSAAGRPAGAVDPGSRQAQLEQQHAKLLQQQQQMLRAQQQALQQQQHLAGMAPRPPPPEYKANPQLIHGLMGQQQQQRFPAAGMRRVNQQPMPPSGPMMRPQQQALHSGGGSVYMGGPQVQHPHHLPPQHRSVGPGTFAGARNTQQRPPNVSIGPEGLNIGVRGGPEWRHMLMSQQQNAAVFSPQMRPSFQQGSHQGSFGLGGSQGGLQMSQIQHQQLVRNQNLGNSPVSQMQMLSQQQSMGLQQSGLASANQMSMNMQMSQSMSVSGAGPPLHPHHPQQQQQVVGYTGSPGTVQGAPHAPTANTASQSGNVNSDFSLEFFEHADSNNFSDLLNSLDSGTPFSLQDIL